MATTHKATGIARTAGGRGIVSLLAVALVAALLAVSAPVGALEPTGWQPVVGDLSDGLGRDLAAVDAALISGGNGRAWALPQTAEGWGDRESLVPVASGQSSDYGSTVGIAESPSGDRRFAVVGDPGAASDVGAAHLFEWTSATGWRSLADLAPDTALADGRFGTAVDVSFLDDKTAILAVSAALDRSGTGVVFTYVIRESVVGGAESVRAATTGATDLFGGDLALDGARLVVGAQRDDDEGSPGALAGTSSVFDADTAAITGGAAFPGFTETARLSQCGTAEAGGDISVCGTSPGEGFGHSVAVDGEVIVVGAWLASQAGGGDAGEVDVFRRVNGTWTLEQRLNSAESAPTDRLGTTVAIQGDRIASSAWNRDSGTGAVVHYTRAAGTWTENAPADRPAGSAPGDRVGQGLAFTDGVLTIGAPGNAAGGRDAGRITTRSLAPVSSATIAFRTTEVLVDETAGDAVLSVAIVGTVAQESVALWIASPADEPGFDPAGPADYAAMGAIVLSPGATTAELRVPIVDDDIYERPEAFEVTLASVDDPGISVGATATALVTVLEDPTDLPLLSLGGETSGVEGTDIAPTIVLDQPASFDLAIPLAVAAVPGSGLQADVQLSTNLIVVPAGATSAPFTVTLRDDVLQEATETVRLLGGPIAGEPMTELGVVTITDDDLAFTLPGLLDLFGNAFVLPVEPFYEGGRLRVDQAVDLAGAAFDGFGIVDATVDITAEREINDAGAPVPGADPDGGGVPPNDPLDGLLDASLVVDALDIDLPFATIFDRTDATTTADPISLAGIEFGAPEPWLSVTGGTVSASYTGSIGELDVSGAVRIDDVDGALIFDDALASATVSGMSGEVGSDGRAVLTATSVDGTFAGVDITLTDTTVRLDPDPSVPFLEAGAADVGPFGINGLRIFRDGTFTIEGGCVAVDELLGDAGLGGLLPIRITSACVESTDDDGARIVEVEGTYDLGSLATSWAAPVTVRIDGNEIADGDPFVVRVELAADADAASLLTPLDLPAVEIEIALSPTSAATPGIEGTAVLAIPAFVGGVAQGPITATLDAQPQLPGATAQVSASGTGTLTIDDAAAGQASLSLDAAITGSGAVDGLLDITSVTGSLVLAVTIDGGRPAAATVAVPNLELIGAVTAGDLTAVDASDIEVRGSWDGSAWLLTANQADARLGALALRDLQLELRGTDAELTASGSAALALEIDGNGDGTVEASASPISIGFAREGDTLRVTGAGSLTSARIAEVLTADTATATVDLTLALDGVTAPTGYVTISAAEFGLFPDAEGTALATLFGAIMAIDTSGSILVAAARLESTLVQAGVTVTVTGPFLGFGPLPQTIPVLSADGARITAVDGEGVTVEIGGLQIFRDSSFTVDSICVSADDLLGEVGLSGIIPIIVNTACVRSTNPDGTRRIEIDGAFDLDAGLANWPGAPTVQLDGDPVADGDPLSIAVDVGPGGVGVVTPVDLPAVTITTTDPGIEGLDGTFTVTTPAVVGGVPQGPITAAVNGTLQTAGATVNVSASGAGTVIDNGDGTATVAIAADATASGSIAEIATITEATGSIDLAVELANGRATSVDIAAASLSLAGELNAPGLAAGNDPLRFTAGYDAGTWTLSVREDQATVGVLTIEDLSIDVTADAASVAVSGSGRLLLDLDGDGDGATVDGPVPVQLAISGTGSAISFAASFGPVPELAVGDVFSVTGATGSGTITIDPAAPAPVGTVDLGGIEARWFPDGDDEFATLNEPELRFDLAGNVSMTASQITTTALGPGITATVLAPTLTFTAVVPQTTPVFTAAGAEITATDVNGSVTLEDLRVFRDGSFDLGSACVTADSGLLGAFGLAGILPFDVTEACAIAEDGDDTLVEITGFFDLDRVDDWPFTTTITIDPDGANRVVTDDETDLHTFSVLIDRADPLGSWPRPVDLPPIRLDIADLDVAGESVSGYLQIPGWIDGAETGAFDGDITFADNGDDDEGTDGIVDLDGSATVDGTIDLTDDGVTGSATITVAATGSVEGVVGDLTGSTTIDIAFAATSRDGIDVDVDVALQSAALSGTLDVAGITWLDASPATVAGSYDSGLWRFAIEQDELTLGGFRAENAALAVTAGTDANGDLLIAAEGTATAILEIDGLDPLTIPVSARAAARELTIDGGLAIETLALGDLLLLDGTGNDTPGEDPTPDATFSLTVGLDDGSVAASGTVALPRAVLLPDDDDGGLVELSDVTGAFSTNGRFTVGFGDATIVLGDAIEVDLLGGQITLGDPAQPLLSIATTTGRIADPDDPTATLLTVDVVGFEISAAGAVSIDSVTVSELGALAEAAGVAGILPFTIDDATITFPVAGNFDQFDLRVGGSFALDRLGDLPFTPVVRIGGSDVTAADEFELGIRVASLREGRIEFVDFGEIELGVRDWGVGPFTLAGSLTITSNGADELPTVAGSIGIKGAADDDFAIDANATVTATPAITTTGGTLDVSFGFEVSASLSSVLEIERVRGTVGFQLVYDGADAAPQVGIENLRFDGLLFDQLAVEIGDLVRFVATDGTFDPLAARGQPIISFADGTVGMEFGKVGAADNPLAGWGGAVGGFDIRNGTTPDGVDDDTLDERLPRVVLLPGFSAEVTIGDLSDLGVEGLPLEVERLGLVFPGVGDDDGIDLRDPDVIPANGIDLETLVDDLTDVRIRFTGGVTRSEELSWPITATVDDLEVDLAIVKNWLQGDFSELPITNISGAEFIMDPINLGPVVIGGGFGIGVITEGVDTPIWYGRVLGDFAYGSFGLGIEIIVSQYGPVAGRLRVPAVIPLGPSTFIVSGARGAIEFDGTTFPRVEVDCEIGEDPANPVETVCTGFTMPDIANPSLSDDDIRTKLTGLAETFANINDPVDLALAVGEQWAKGFTFTIGGSLTQAAVTGVVSGDITLGANVALDLAGGGADNRLQLIGQGDLTVYGTGLGRVNLIMDYSEPLDPIITLGFGVPAGGDLLSMLLPGEAELIMTLDTEGLYAAPLIGMRELLVGLATNAANDPQLAALVLPLIDVIAAQIEANRSSNLGRLVLGGLDPAAIPETINGAWLLDRLVVGDNVPALIPDIASKINAEEGVFEDILLADLQLAGEVVSALMLDLYAAATTPTPGTTPPDISEFVDLNDPEQVGLAERLGILSPGLESTNGMDVAFAITQAIVAAVSDSAATAFAVANPLVAVRGIIQPKLLGIPVGEPTAELTIAITKDEIGLTTTGSIKDMTLMAVSVCQVCGIALGAASLGPLVTDRTTMQFTAALPFSIEDLLRDGTFPALDPYQGDWAASMGGELLIAGFAVGELRGLVVPGTIDPSGINPVVTDFVGDGLALPLTDAEVGRINQFGGVLVDGSLQFPDFFVDPQGTLAAVLANGDIPDDPLEFFTWAQANLDVLSATTDAGGFQLYLPTPAPEIGEVISSLSALDPIEDADAIRDVIADSGLQGAIDTLFGDARVEAEWDLDFLGFPVSDGHLRVGQGADGTEGVIAEIDFPWLPQAVEFVGRTVEIGTGREAIPWPTIGGEVTIAASDVAAMLAELGLDTDVFAHAGGSATLRAYSPGYDAEGTDLQRTGGVEIELQVTIDGLVENVTVVLTLTPPTNGLIPNISASLAVDTLTVGPLTIDINELTLERSGDDVSLVVDGSVDHPLFSGTVRGEVGGTLDFTGVIRVPGTTTSLTATGSITSSGQVSLAVGTQRTINLGPLSLSGTFRVAGSQNQPFRLFADGDVSTDVPGLGSVDFDALSVSTDGTFAIDANITLGTDEVRVVGATVSLERVRVAPPRQPVFYRIDAALGGGELTIAGSAQGETLPLITASFPGAELAIDETVTIPGLDLGPAFVIDPADFQITGDRESLAIELIGDVDINGLGGAAGMTLRNLEVRSNGFVDGDIRGRVQVAGTRFGQADFTVSRSSGNGPITVTMGAAASVDVGDAGNLVVDLDGFFRSNGQFSFNGSSAATLRLPITDTFVASYDFSVGVDNTGGPARFTAEGEVCLPYTRIEIRPVGPFGANVPVTVTSRECIDVEATVATNGVIFGSGDFGPLGTQTFNFPLGIAATNGGGGSLPTFSGVPDEPIRINPPTSSGVEVDGELYYEVDYTPPAAGANAVSCSPASGTALTPGIYPVTCTAINEFGSASVSFDVELIPLFQAITIVVQLDSGETEEPAKNDREEPVVEQEQVLVLTGSNALPGSRGRAAAYSERTELTTFVVSADGTWSVDVVIPQEIPVGRHTIVIEVEDVDGRLTLQQQPIEVVAPAPEPACTITGTEGRDWLIGTNGDDVICGLGGDDLILGLGGNDRLVGGEGNDRLLGGWDNDVLLGGDGNDRLYGGFGDDRADGGEGDDRLYGNHGDDRLQGGDGVDELRGGSGHDDIEGGAGNDTIHGDSGADIVRGGDDGDLIYGGSGNDDLDGGRGKDIVLGETGDDRLGGGDDGDLLGGQEGDDVLDGGAGDDWLVGGIGDDALYGGPGNDLLSGQEGDDVEEQDAVAPI